MKTQSYETSSLQLYFELEINIQGIQEHSINEKLSYYHKNLLSRSKRSIYHLFNDIFGKSSTILSNKSTFSNNQDSGYYVCTIVNIRKHSISYSGMCQRGSDYQ